MSSVDPEPLAPETNDLATGDPGNHGPNLDPPSATELAELVRSEAAAVGRTVDLGCVELRSGWESVVLDTLDGWIYRFPRAHVDFQRELAILRKLRGRLPVPIPDPEWVGSRTWFMAYRRLEGAQFDPVAYRAASAVERDRLAASLAGFLAAMHGALTPDEAVELGLRGSGEEAADDGDLDRIAARVDDPDVAGVLDASTRASVSALLEQVRGHRGRYRDTARLVLHDDFNFSNLALTGPVGELAAVWDFSCVHVGDPSADLRYLWGDSPDLFDRVVAAYRRSAGRDLDPRSAVLAHRLELISDALELDDPGVLNDRVPRWPVEDARLLR